MPKFAIVVLSTCLAGASVAAQTTPPKPPVKPAAQAPQTKALAATSATFVKDAAQGSMAEVELATLALSKATRDDVKQLAQKLKDDHTSASNELMTLASSKSVTLPSAVSAMQKATADRLGKLSGAAFDKAYVDEMVKDHVKDVAEFRKHESDSDADVKAFAAKTRPILEGHLSQAQAVQKAIGGK
jgi:putative membrane protein